MINKIKLHSTIALFIIAVFTLLSSCDKKPIKLTRPLTSLEEIKSYLLSFNKSETGKSPDKPIFLPVALEGGLGVMTDEDSNWQQLLLIIKLANIFTNLDLSLCKMEADKIFELVNYHDIGRNNIISLTLPDVAETIQSSIVNTSEFTYFNNLKYISGVNVINICDNVFFDMHNLIGVEFPSAEFIGSRAFSGCIGLNSIKIEKVQIIEKYAFANTYISSADFPKALNIGEGAFSNCKNIKELNLPKAQHISNNAFASCTSLSSVNLPQAVSIGNSAFTHCFNLKEINFPADAIIGETPFVGCTSLVSFNLSGEGDLSVIEEDRALVRNYKMETNRIQPNENGSELISYPTAKDETKIPNITKIASSAFEDCKELKSVYFPDVTEIGENIFKNCENLESVNLPALIKIPRSAFEELKKLDAANFPTALLIEENAFKNCSSLTKINIPSVQYIESEAFAIDFETAEDFSLDIYFGNTAPNLGTNTFFGAKKIINVIVPKGATGYGTVPAIYESDDNEQNWGNGLRGKGWDGHTGGYNIGAVNSNITVNITFIK